MSTTIETTITPATKTRQRISLRPHIRLTRLVAYLILITFAIVYLGPLLMLVNTAFKTLPSFMKDATAPNPYHRPHSRSRRAARIVA